MDVKPLHTIILNDEGISAFQQKIDIFTKKIVATKVTTKFLALILTLNKRLCYGNNMHPYLGKQIHVRVLREIHLSSH